MADIDFIKLKAVEWVTIIFSTVAIFLSGILFIYSFKNELFFKLDTLKLAILSAAITCPVWLVNCIIAIQIRTFTSSKTVLMYKNQFFAVMGGCFSIVIIYLPIIVNFYYKYPLGIAIGFILTVESIMLLSVFLATKYAPNRISDNVQPTNQFPQKLSDYRNF
jgi:hypothetical protein